MSARGTAADQLIGTNMADKSKLMAREVAGQLIKNKMADNNKKQMMTQQQLPAREAAAFKRLMKCYEERQFKLGLKFAKQILGKKEEEKLYRVITPIEGQNTVVFFKNRTFCRTFFALGIAPTHVLSTVLYKVV